MEYILNHHATWSQFFIGVITLLVLYFLLRFGRQILANTTYLGNYRLPLLKFIDRVLLFYEPLVLLVLVSLFILVRPALHGLWVLLLIVGGFSHIRNYISGRILQMDSNIALGSQIEFQNQKGVISRIGRLGLQLKSDKGTHHINYSRLLSEGFMQVSGEELGGYYYKLKILTQDKDTHHPTHLKDLLASTPYLDWNFKPSLNNAEEGVFHTKVMVREEEHLQDLIRLIEEWGYQCQTI